MRLFWIVSFELCTRMPASQNHGLLCGQVKHAFMMMAFVAPNDREVAPLRP